MGTPSFTWSDIINAANSFLSNDFVAGCIIVILALGIVTKLAEFMKGVIEDLSGVSRVFVLASHIS